MASSGMQLTPAQQASIQYQMQNINESRKPESVGVTILFLTLSTAALVMRFWARKVARAPYKWDDWTALAGWVRFLQSLGLMSTNCMSCRPVICVEIIWLSVNRYRRSCSV